MSAFFTIFVSVFLAELGDKTQIATALFAGEGDRPPWLVFLASASALVLSTALATLVGSLLRGFIEGPWLKIAAGIGFIIIGVLTLWSVLKPA
ncbi:MAG: TMEM165/GDT1 family protein [Alphaproteobacteria bacterium]